MEPSEYNNLFYHSGCGLTPRIRYGLYRLVGTCDILFGGETGEEGATTTGVLSCLKTWVCQSLEYSFFLGWLPIISFGTVVSLRAKIHAWWHDEPSSCFHLANCIEIGSRFQNATHATCSNRHPALRVVDLQRSTGTCLSLVVEVEENTVYYGRAQGNPWLRCGEFPTVARL